MIKSKVSYLKLFVNARYIWVLVVFVVGCFVLINHAAAATKTWDGECGVDTTWSCANNWSDNAVPLAGDTVIFDNTSDNNSTIDNATFAGTVTTININSGYDGTITMTAPFTVSTSFSQAAGNFTASNQTLDLDGTFTLSGGNFTASSTSTLLGGAMTISGTPGFTANGGTFTFDGSTTASLSCNSVSFNLVTFSHSSGTKTVGSSCSLPLGNNPTLGSGSAALTVNGTISGTGTITSATGTLLLGTTGSFSGFSGITTGSALTINGTLNAGSYSPFDVNGTFQTGASSNFTAPSGTMTVSGFFTTNATGVFTANGGTITFDGTTSATITCNGATFNLVTFTHTTAVTKTISGTCTLPLGANPTIGGDNNADFSNAGVLSGSGTLTIGTAASTNLFTLSGTSSMSGFSGLIAGALTLSATNTHNYSSYSTFVLNGAYNQSGSGTLTVPNGADFNSTFAQAASSGAVFNAPSGTMTVSNAFTSNTGTTFNHNGGTVAFDGSTSGAITCNGTISFNLVQLTHTAATKTVNSGCTLPLGANPTLGTGGVNGGVTVNGGTLSGSGTLTLPSTSTTLNLQGAAALSGFTGLVAGNLTVSGATLNAGSYNPLTLAGTFALQSSGVFTAPTGTMTVSGHFTLNSGTTYNANGGTLTLSGGTATIACNNSSFNIVNITHTSGTKTIENDCNLPIGANPTIPSSVTLSGTLTGTGTLTFSNASGIFTIASTGALSGFSGLTLNCDMTISAATVDLGSYVPVDLNSNFTLSSGAVFTAPTGTMTVADEFTLNSGTTFNANGGTLIFDSAFGSTLACNNTAFNLVVFNNTSTKTVNSDCNLPLGANPGAGAGGGIRLSGTLSGTGTLTTTATLTLNSGFALSGFTGLNALSLTVDGATANFGSYTPLDIDKDFFLTNNATFTASSGNMNVGGDFEVQSGSIFNHNNGTVFFDDGDQIINGANTFNNLNITFAAAAFVEFPANTAQTILGTLTLKGASASALLTLKSDTPGTYWQIDPRGTVSAEFVSVSDSQNLGGIITACNSTDAGHNLGWNINPSSCSSSSVSTSAKKRSSSVTADAIAPLTETEEESIESKPKTTDSSEQTAAQPDSDNSSSLWLYLLLGGGGLGMGLGLFALAKRRRKEDEPVPPVRYDPGSG